jgi:hypothetical protein
MGIPVVTGWGSCFTADCTREDPECLTPAPQAATARPAARMFLAALISRSCRVRQPGQVQCRVLKESSASRYPHAEQVFDDGPGCGSTPAGRSRTYGSAPPAAPHPGTPGTGKPSSPLQDRTSNRKTAGAAPYGRLSSPAPLLGIPDSYPAGRAGHPARSVTRRSGLN